MRRRERALERRRAAAVNDDRGCRSSHTNTEPGVSEPPMARFVRVVPERSHLAMPGVLARLRTHRMVATVDLEIRDTPSVADQAPHPTFEVPAAFEPLRQSLPQ